MTRCTLIPINLHNPDEYAELKAQRVQCGWDSTDTALLKWRAKQDENLKSFFWITVPSESAPSKAIRVGHISLDAYSDPPDLGLASPDKSTLTIQNFFIRPEHRGSGLGNHVLALAEGMATQEPWGSPRCRFVTINTLSKRYFYAEGPEGKGMWARLGGPAPKICNAEWYERRGYVWWKSEPRYQERTSEGEEVRLWADFMRKAVMDGEV
ncbi:GNAT family N-acetyltransferase [Aspergillus clavatus NRRL 1]|uniref:Uncharacterized protein n=1 Tax=Aspergillus clavatus (strain ATCC 1007 / CBS 513.65 / DSM 816 / NCTC 3887 / NRRL 1 / QM 1276 / 107) TaxID=344612 RepID=A1CHN9_ASPCL|nr:uncharacterized protein ACLA_048660 [Aspergillus clavatus NRRL 1]EAW10394.1 conserved hypothetical protein [Aspergillus clavatus NRRL 1]